jgi:serine protease Do
MRQLLLVSAFLLALGAACDGGGGSFQTATPTVATPARPSNAPDDGLDAIQVVRVLRPSVVHIQSEGTLSSAFGQQPAGGVGTGVIIDNIGQIVTNNHVIRLDPNDLVDGPLASRIQVTLSDQRTFEAKVIGTDPFTDIAVLQIDAPDIIPCTIGDAAQIEVGESVLALGFPLDLPGGLTATKGIVSAKDRFIQEAGFTIPSAIQTDAAINPGNSGGPLVNSHGEVIGINTAIIPSAEGIGFAISTETFRPVVAELIADGQVERGFLGIRIFDITPGVAAANDLPVESGVGVVEVTPGSAADRGGIQAMDIIVGIAGSVVRSSGDLFQILAEHGAGELIEVELFRGNDRLETEVTLTERPE